MSHFCALTLLYFVLVGVALGCDGFQGKIHYFRSCNKGRNHFHVDLNSTLVLTKNCEVEINTCVIAKGFKTAIVKPTLYVNDIVMFNTEIDLCAVFKAQHYLKQIKITQDFGLPTKCPVETTIICDRKPIIIDIKPYKRFLLLGLGTIRYKGIMITDNGTTCYDAEGSLFKV